MNNLQELAEGKEHDPFISHKQAPSSVYTKRQRIIFVWILIALFFVVMEYSLQGPIFPKEAELKGISSSLFGLVFGIFEFANFFVAPICGHFITKIGSKFMLNAGAFMTGSFCILFGFLYLIPAGTPFIALAFMIRLGEALGQAGFMTASYAIVTYEFPNNVGTAFSIMETVVGIAVVAGPVVGSLLYDAGGFYLPFVAVGASIFLTTSFTTTVLPHIDDTKKPKPSFFRLLRIPSALLSFYVCVTASISFNFFLPIMEPYLRQFELSTPVASLIFVINGALYALTCSLWGWLADKYVNPKLLCGLGSIILMISFLIVGPAEFIPLEPSLWLVIIGQVLNGMGNAAEYVSSYVDCNRAVLKNGFPNTTETFGMISGMWTAGMSLGGFLGTSLAGVLYDAVGFRNACLLNVALHALVGGFNLAYLVYEKRKSAASVKVESETSEPEARLHLTPLTHLPNSENANQEVLINSVCVNSIITNERDY